MMMNSILMSVLLAASSGEGKNKPEAKEPGKIYICESKATGKDKDIQLKNCKKASPEPTPSPTPRPPRPSRH